MVKIQHEAQILDERFRAQVIQEIEGSENRTRKYEAYKRYHCYKDKTSAYVVELLLSQFERGTVDEMRYALSNISFVRKVVDKLARVYSNGVERTISGDEEATKKLRKLEKLLNFNSKMKTANRFLKLHKNTAVFTKPYPSVSGKYKIVLDILQPFVYDALEYDYNRTEAIAYVMSDYIHPSTHLADTEARRSVVAIESFKPDGVDQTIANSPDDKGAGQGYDKKYIWWSEHYHFTTNAKGQIVSSGPHRGVDNPLKSSNHVNFSVDQDGSFWAQGGSDMIDGAILINAMITHTSHVGVSQGYGQFYMTGSNLPRNIKLGVNKAIVAEYDKDQHAEPKLGYLQSSPLLGELQNLIEMYVALYLTSNNLSTSGVSTQMSGGKDFASGIAIVLDKAESIEDVNDQRQVFIDNEVQIWKDVNNCLKLYGSNLSPEFRGLELPEGFEEKFTMVFDDATALMTEKEKLEILSMRKKLGIDSRIGLIMRDNPTLTEEQAEEVLLKIIEDEILEAQQKLEAAKAAGVDLPEDGEEEEENPEDSNEDPDDENSEDLEDDESNK